MDIKVVKDRVNFEPITVNVTFKITSYEELAEFVRYANDNGDVSHYNGDNSYILSELVEKISEAVLEGL